MWGEDGGCGRRGQGGGGRPSRLRPRREPSTTNSCAQEEQQRHLNNLASFHEDLPGPEALLPLLAARDGAPSLGEYLALLRAPDVDTDGELAWPAEAGLCV